MFARFARLALGARGPDHALADAGRLAVRSNSVSIGELL